LIDAAYQPLTTASVAIPRARIFRLPRIAIAAQYERRCDRKFSRNIHILITSIDAPELEGATFVVVGSMGEFDEAGVARALALKPLYLGVIASRRRYALLRDALIARGIDTSALAAPSLRASGATAKEPITPTRTGWPPSQVSATQRRP